MNESVSESKTELSKHKLPALEGWFTMDPENPRLLGSRCTSCRTYYFPKITNFCKNPDCDGDVFEEVPLSRTGKVWSFTNAVYQPPAPFVAPDPFVPFTVAAVELADEKMIVLGQVVEGVNVADLKAGMDMELVLETLHEDDEVEKLVWKWKPVAAQISASGEA